MEWGCEWDYKEEGSGEREVGYWREKMRGVMIILWKKRLMKEVCKEIVTCV